MFYHVSTKPAVHDLFISFIYWIVFTKSIIGVCGTSHIFVLVVLHILAICIQLAVFYDVL
jgi:hypothetical protein